VIITPIADADTTSLLECHTFETKRSPRLGASADGMGRVE
jgi:hypothetical protein